MNNERRKFSRTRLERLNYVHLLPENGAIILNISERGLGFHAVGPIHEAGPIRFSFSLQGNRIEAAGDLAWIDRKRKTGGLHLTEISTAAGHPLDVWLSRLRSAELQTMSLQKTRPELRSVSPAPGNAPEGLLAQPSVRIQANKPELARSFTMIRRKLPGTGSWLNAGVVAIAFIVFVAFAALLTHTSASRLDNSSTDQHDSLRVNPGAAKPPAQAVPSQSGLRETPEETQTSESLQELRNEIEALKKGYNNETGGERAGFATPGDKSQQADQNDANPPAQTVGTAPVPVVPVDHNGESSLGTESSPKSSPEPDDGGAVSDALAVPEAAETTVDPATATYFEVGNFKERLWAGKATDDLVKLGFHATVVHKSVLWMQSFHVLVGLFGNGSDLETARTKLETLGFSPRMAKTH